MIGYRVLEQINGTYQIEDDKLQIRIPAGRIYLPDAYLEITPPDNAYAITPFFEQLFSLYKKGTFDGQIEPIELDNNSVNILAGLEKSTLEQGPLLKTTTKSLLEKINP